MTDFLEQAQRYWPYADLSLYVDDLDAIKEKVADRTGWRERRAALLLAVGRHGEAGEEYLALLKRNPEHFGWHAGLQAAAHPLVHPPGSALLPGGSAGRRRRGPPRPCA